MTLSQPLWSRRRLLSTAAATSAATLLSPRELLAAPAVACRLTPELTVGPYYVDKELLRSDIRENKPGLPLHLSIVILNARTCQPLADAAVDIWHCDAGGIYSGYTKMNPDKMDFGPGGGPPPPMGSERHQGPPPAGDGQHGPPQTHTTDNETFLRGVQRTGKNGVAKFLTIYPGWYVTRDTHIHLKVHTGGHAQDAKYAGGHVRHIGQIAFPDELSDKVALLEPYTHHKAPRTRPNHDTVFHGDLSGVMLHSSQVTPEKLSDGLYGSITFWVDPEAEPGPEGFPGPGGPPPPRQ
ncbi:intradiol ring-cleavage dioxygenase [Terriglobus tenax]|uniref:intradiol ring-cleavage dioxygenase n=1 Tax=Terriglobus tenax TaxID=1111115 RepID=UPI0021E00214|nr:intradiol ring-cleavage dioxygenase [Terriglobus tenax]